MAQHHGHDWGVPNLDALAIFYISFAAIYTLVVFAGLFALFLLRNTHAVRIRSFPVTLTAVLVLHMYLVLIFLVYPLNGKFKCGWEFWIMNILLPSGMALFQGWFASWCSVSVADCVCVASNIRLYSYAKEQKDIAEGKYFGTHIHRWNWRNPKPLQWYRHATIETRAYAGICVGMSVQVRVETPCTL